MQRTSKKNSIYRNWWKSLLVFSFIIITSLPSFATHNRAGEIVYKQLSAYTFEITVLTYTSTLPGVADRPFLDVHFGDGSIQRVERISEVFFPNNYKRNTYISKHTYPGPGIYRILVEDPNRNFGVNNIPNSVYTVFSVSTTLMVSGNIGENSTPLLLNPPIDKAALTHLFIHNPAAFDPDGDSLSYKLTPCTSEDGQPIAGYTYPPASNTFYMDSFSGDLIWDSPVDTGSYNVAIQISEWRNDIRIGSITRDMQIDVFETDNNPPEIDSIPDFCIIAGDSLDFTFSSIDVDNDSIKLIAMGGPFVVAQTPASSLQTLTCQPGICQSRFRWKTSCSNIMASPYRIVIKAEDNNPDISLVDMKTFTVKVMGPAPMNVTTSSSTSSISLAWETPECTNISGYRVYRSEVISDWEPDSCTTGVPPISEFILIGETNGANSFLDNNKGIGLPQGVDYCYRITAIYNEKAEGKPSDKICARLISGTPVISNVSVLNNHQTEGQVELKWHHPAELDTLNLPGPFHYRILRAQGVWGEFFKEIELVFNILDTVYIDSNINTTDSVWCYRVQLIHTPNSELIGYVGEASSILPEFEGSDNQISIRFSSNTPWTNNHFSIYRKAETDSEFQLIGETDENVFVDNQVENGKPYQYFALVKGHYIFYENELETQNISHTRTAMAQDDVPPCAPQLWVNVNCDSLYNIITWQKPEEPCGDDITGYILFYNPLVDETPDSLTYLSDEEPKQFIHPMFTSLGGHYGIVSVDENGNRSEMVTAIAADTCRVYKLPNVFSPNADGVNDFFIPMEFSHHFVERIHIQVFNRKGELVFETTDPYINWDGTYLGKGRVVPPGVYYYICDVYERRSVGIYEGPPLVGFIHIFTNVESVKMQE